MGRYNVFTMSDFNVGLGNDVVIIKVNDESKDKCEFYAEKNKVPIS